MRAKLPHRLETYRRGDRDPGEADQSFFGTGVTQCYRRLRWASTEKTGRRILEMSRLVAEKCSLISAVWAYRPGRSDVSVALSTSSTTPNPAARPPMATRCAFRRRDSDRNRPVEESSSCLGPSIWGCICIPRQGLPFSPTAASARPGCWGSASLLRKGFYSLELLVILPGPAPTRVSPETGFSESGLAESEKSLASVGSGRLRCCSQERTCSSIGHSALKTSWSNSSCSEPGPQTAAAF